MTGILILCLTVVTGFYVALAYVSLLLLGGFGKLIEALVPSGFIHVLGYIVVLGFPALLILIPPTVVGWFVGRSLEKNAITLRKSIQSIEGETNTPQKPIRIANRLIIGLVISVVLIIMTGNAIFLIGEHNRAVLAKLHGQKVGRFEEALHRINSIQVIPRSDQSGIDVSLSIEGRREGNYELRLELGLVAPGQFENSMSVVSGVSSLGLAKRVLPLQAGMHQESFYISCQYLKRARGAFSGDIEISRLKVQAYLLPVLSSEESALIGGYRRELLQKGAKEDFLETKWLHTMVSECR
jgi:hypothetical protein